MNSTGKILSAFTVGAILGILFAPAKGSETRQHINEQGKKVGENLEDEFTRLREKFNELKKDFEEIMKNKAKEFV